jgi:hypothetical protein
MPTVLERLEDGLFQNRAPWARPGDRCCACCAIPPPSFATGWQGEISVRAMSLAYTTLLSLVPLMVFSFAILKGIGARTDLHFILHRVLPPAGEASNQLTESVLSFVANMRGDVLGSHRAGIPDLYGAQHHSKGGDQLQLRLARAARAQFRAPLHRVPERHDRGPDPARGRARLLGSALHSPTARNGSIPSRIWLGASGARDASCPMPSSRSCSRSCMRSFRTRASSCGPL